MKLSVIIVSYNEKEYLAKAIRSCLAQDMEDYEIIIGDDGSNDGSLEIIEDYAHRYPGLIRYFVMERDNPQNVIASFRVSALLKKAFSLSKGEYLTILSGDDLFLKKDKCRKQVEFLDNHKECASCYTDFLYFWDNGRKKESRAFHYGTKTLLWASFYVHISCFVFKRDVTKQLLPRFCDDNGLVYSIIMAGETGYLKGCTFGYRQRDASIMHQTELLEFHVTELSLYQDILNGEKPLIWGAMAHYSRSIHYVFKHRNELSDQKYKKYLDSNKTYSNDITNRITQYESRSLFYKLLFRLKLPLHIAAFFHYRILELIYKGLSVLWMHNTPYGIRHKK